VLDRSDFAAYDRLDRAHLGYALRTCLRPRPRLESFERVCGKTGSPVPRLGS